ncbi:non-specific lipid transfer protein GPI-anchored 1-like [Macadamia integrifolia]|uniref:non-specific lipid transfer protein GPI-anchored 1-like n=1 Tax=Macadamia integrifolia TaxID=60698 RepID=UPI001C4F7FE2|nr:non-specific lipid transfer protein GPI-anchored 1-like [Macadamia integrifolia]
MMMKKNTLFLTVLLVFFVFQIGQSSSASVEQDCSTELTKVSPCLTYATGKSASPSAECCSAVSEIKNKNPVCLCYIIQQTHDGLPSLKQMGLQEDKLIQLPTTCKLVNASISDCPKLLKLSPSSPDAAVFTNTSSAATSNSTTATPTSSANSTSNGFKHGLLAAGPTALTNALAVFISVFPSGLFFLV